MKNTNNRLVFSPRQFLGQCISVLMVLLRFVSHLFNVQERQGCDRYWRSIWHSVHELIFVAAPIFIRTPAPLDNLFHRHTWFD